MSFNLDRDGISINGFHIMKFADSDSEFGSTDMISFEGIEFEPDDFKDICGSCDRHRECVSYLERSLSKTIAFLKSSECDRFQSVFGKSMKGE